MAERMSQPDTAYGHNPYEGFGDAGEPKSNRGSQRTETMHDEFNPVGAPTVQPPDIRQEPDCCQRICPVKLTEAWFRRVLIKVAITQYVCASCSIVSGVLTLVLCNHAYFVNNGIATGSFVLLAFTVNIMFVCGFQLATRTITALFIVNSFIIGISGGLCAMVAGPLGVVCEIMGAGDLTYRRLNGTLHYDQTLHKLTDLCPSAYFGLRNICWGQDLDLGEMYEVQLFAHRQNFIAANIILTISGSLIALSSFYLAIMAIRFVGTIPKNAKIRSIRTIRQITAAIPNLGLPGPPRRSDTEKVKGKPKKDQAEPKMSKNNSQRGVKFDPNMAQNVFDPNMPPGPMLLPPQPPNHGAFETPLRNFISFLLLLLFRVVVTCCLSIDNLTTIKSIRFAYTKPKPKYMGPSETSWIG